MNRALTLFLGLAVAVIVCWLLQVLKFVFLPLVLAVFISFLLSPLVAWLHKRRVPLILAVTLCILLTLAVIYALGTIVLQGLVSFQDEFPKYELRFREMAAQVEDLLHLEYGPLARERIQRELAALSLSSIVGSTLNSFFSFLIYLLFTFVFVIYFLLGNPRLPDKIRRAFDPERAVAVNEAIDNIGRQVQRYIMAKTLTSFITGAIMLIICLLFGVDFAVTWGFFTFLLNFIPTLGVLMASIPAVLTALIQYASWVYALWLALTLAAVMIALGQFIEPRILGESVDLSPLVTLFSLIFWGWLWGPAGMLVAVPVTALIRFTCVHVESLRPLGVLMSGEA
ncbi:MAG: AI-2E family transporter [Thermodesulfobacteriota bacterium]